VQKVRGGGAHPKHKIVKHSHIKIKFGHPIAGYAVEPKEHKRKLARLKELGIPVEKVLEFREGTIVSKDISKGGKRKTITPIFRDEKPVKVFVKHCRNKKAVLKGIFRDLGIMHANGIVVDPQYHAFDPWLVYEKTKGKWARAVIDTGAVKKRGDFKGENLWDGRGFKAGNLNEMLYYLEIFNKIMKIPGIEEECREIYLKYSRKRRG
jgi:hypothetical protein